MTTNALSERARRNGLGVLLAATFLMFGGFFMLVPLISVHYVRDLQFAAVAVGIALAVRQLTQQSLTLFGGALADLWGAKWLICAGMLLRAVGFAGLAWADTFAALLMSCVVAALGGALFDAPRNAAIVALTEPASRARYFSLAGIVGGVGMTLGPLVGALLISASWALVCWISAACFALGGVLTIVLLPDVRVVAERQPMWHGLGLAMRDAPFVALTGLLAGYWFLWVQLSISLPLVAQQFASYRVQTPLGIIGIGGVATIYTINAGLTVILQYPLLALAQRTLRPLPILTLGIGLMGLGLGAIMVVSSTAQLLLCVAIFSVGALLVQPVQQTVTADLAHSGAVGAYFGFSALALAFGGGAGNFMGGWLYDLASEIGQPAVPWIVFASVGAVVCSGLIALDRLRFRDQRTTAPSVTNTA